MTKIQRLLLTGLGLWGMHAQAQSLCVYDPMGAQGDSYAFMKDYALAAKQWGAEISLQPYPDDQRASDDFKSGKCDALATTGIRARQFNSFSGSIDSAGAVPDEAISAFMEHCKRRVGEVYFRTPRSSITAFVNLLRWRS